LLIVTTASAWVWSTKANGMIAWRIASTDGVGADGSVIAARWARTMSPSPSAGSSAIRRSASSRTGANPAASIVLRSQPLPLI